MLNTLAIAGGGALGALFRFWSSKWMHSLFGVGFPYGTLFVNVAGSLVMGFLYVLLVERVSLAPEWRAFLMIGFLGAFTTFSTFSLETLQLFNSGELFKAALNIILSVLLCLAAVWFGMFAGRQL